MKRFSLLLMAGALCFGSAFSQTNEETDSTNMSHRFIAPDSVLINRTDGQLTVRVYGEKDNPHYAYVYQANVGNNDWDLELPLDNAFSHNKRAKSRFSIKTGGFGFGFVNALNAPDPMDVKMSSSFEFFWDHIVALQWSPRRNGTKLSIGVGLDWKNYRMTGATRFIKEPNQPNLGFGDYPEGTDPKFSRLKVFAITMPVMFNQSFGKGFSLSAGAVVNFNTHASMKTKYVEGGNDIAIANSNIHQRKVTVDLMGRIGFKAISYYIKYSPMSVLNTAFGPDFKSLSTGITLFY